MRGGMEIMAGDQLAVAENMQAIGKLVDLGQIG